MTRTRRAPALPPALEALLVETARDVLGRAVNHWLPVHRAPVGGARPAAPAAAMPPSDPYRVLGLPHTAKVEDVKRRRRQLAAIFHSDVSDGDAQKMTEINAAANALLRKLTQARR